MSEPHEVEILKHSVRRWKRTAIVSWGLFALLLAAVVAGAWELQREEAVRRDRATQAVEETLKEAEQLLSETRVARQRDKLELAKTREEAEQLLYASQLSLAQRAWEHAEQKKTKEPPKKK